MRNFKLKSSNSGFADINHRQRMCSYRQLYRRVRNCWDWLDGACLIELILPEREEFFLTASTEGESLFLLVVINDIDILHNPFLPIPMLIALQPARTQHGPPHLVDTQFLVLILVVQRFFSTTA